MNYILNGRVFKHYPKEPCHQDGYYYLGKRAISLSKSELIELGAVPSEDQPMVCKHEVLCGDNPGWNHRCVKCGVDVELINKSDEIEMPDGFDPKHDFYKWMKHITIAVNQLKGEK